MYVCMYILSATYSQGSNFSKLVDCTVPLMSPITINGHPTHKNMTSLRNKLQASAEVNPRIVCSGAQMTVIKCQTSNIKAWYALTWVLVVFLMQTTNVITK